MKKQIVHTDCISCQHRLSSAFCQLKPEELASLNQYKVTTRIKKGQTLFYEGDVARGLHCVQDGKVKLFKTLQDGTTQILRISIGADLIGYRGLLGDGKYIATAETLEESVICFIPKIEIFELVSSNMQFSLSLMSVIASDLSKAESKAINFLQKSSKERLAEALLLMEKSFGVTHDGFINVQLTREEIASITGMATETTIRALHEWESEGLINLQKKYIRIANKEALIVISNIED